MENKDNKTQVLETVKLTNYTKLIGEYPCQIATVTKEGLPNLSVASDVIVLDDKTILISNNEMIHTPDNVVDTQNMVVCCFNEEWAGVRLTGKATYHTKGQYFELCNQHFKTETNTPKGAIVFVVEKVEGMA